MQNQRTFKTGKYLFKSLLICILLFSFNANSQVLVTDIIPDTIISNNSIFILDINNDGADDIKFVHEDSTSGLNGNGIGLALLHTDIEFMGDMPPYDPSHYYPYKLDINTPIDSNASTMTWCTKHPQPDMIRVMNILFYTNANIGEWTSGVIDDYLGFRLKINHNWHYGWILIDVAASATQMTVKSYAYRANPDSTVLAGEGLCFPADSVSNIIASDINNNANGSDINVSFNKATNENTIDKYQLIVVPVSYISSFNLQVAQSLNSSSYTQINPNGANVSIDLDSNILDAQGNPIAEYIDYVVYVLSIANYSNANSDFLSAPSSAFTLSNTSGIKRHNNSANPFVYLEKSNLFVKQAKQENLRINLYNISGSLVYSTKSSELTISIPVNGFPKGIYLLHLINKKESIVRKLFL